MTAELYPSASSNSAFNSLGANCFPFGGALGLSSLKPLWPVLELLRARLDGDSLFARFLDNGRMLF